MPNRSNCSGNTITCFALTDNITGDMCGTTAKYAVIGLTQLLLMDICRRKSDQSDPDWLVQMELSRRVSAAHHAAEQCLTKANRALHTLEKALRALTHMVYVLPCPNRV